MHRILVAYDGGAPARRALSTAIELARSHADTSVGVVGVVPFRPGRHGMVLDRVEVTDSGDTLIEPVHMQDVWETAADTTDALMEATRVLEQAGIQAEVLKPWGDPAATIERVAEDGGYDTIVIGSRNLGPLARLIKGSVSRHVADHAAATVVVAR